MRAPAAWDAPGLPGKWLSLGAIMHTSTIGHFLIPKAEGVTDLANQRRLGFMELAVGRRYLHEAQNDVFEQLAVVADDREHFARDVVNLLRTSHRLLEDTGRVGYSCFVDLEDLLESPDFLPADQAIRFCKLGPSENRREEHPTNVDCLLADMDALDEIPRTWLQDVENAVAICIDPNDMLLSSQNTAESVAGTLGVELEWAERELDVGVGQPEQALPVLEQTAVPRDLILADLKETLVREIAFISPEPFH